MGREAMIRRYQILNRLTINRLLNLNRELLEYLESVKRNEPNQETLLLVHVMVVLLQRRQQPRLDTGGETFGSDWLEIE